MDADQYRLGTPPEKSKTENVRDADKQLNPSMDLEKAALNSRTEASETGKQTELKQKGFEDSVLKMDAQCSTDRKTVSLQNLTKDFEGKLNVSSPSETNSNQTSLGILEEAIKLKDRADHFKNSGLMLESHETYFQAGLKFLHAASLLKESSIESSQHWEMSQMQHYDTAGKLFKSCAHEYESRQEMASAALAYKCMVMAYVRLVHCKISSSDRALDEMVLAVQMDSQGKSPSSASDVDNLYNHAAVDKATLSRGTNTLVAGNQVISRQICSNWISFLDYTQYLEFALKACGKCQRTLKAATAINEEAKARNVDTIAAINSAIDEDEDVDEFVRLVQVAMEAINRAGLGAAKD